MTADFDPAGEGIEILAPLRARVVPQWERWWLGCDSGWHPLLARLADDLTSIAPEWTLTQAKQKFATLSFYASPRSDDPAVIDRFRRRIAEAEEESARTCERCGQPGRLWHNSRGGVKTVCETCAPLVEAEWRVWLRTVLPDEREDDL